MLAPRLREVHVANGTKHFTQAVVMTILSVAAALFLGGPIWRAFSGIIWSRLLILLLVALWATSLANLWARACYEVRRGRRADLSFDQTVSPIELRRESDV
jgi:hypothetical protein